MIASTIYSQDYISNITNKDYKSDWKYSETGNPFDGSTKIARLSSFKLSKERRFITSSKAHLAADGSWYMGYYKNEWQRKYESTVMEIVKTNTDEIKVWMFVELPGKQLSNQPELSYTSKSSAWKSFGNFGTLNVSFIFDNNQEVIVIKAKGIEGTRNIELDTTEDFLDKLKSGSSFHVRIQPAKDISVLKWKNGSQYRESVYSWTQRIQKYYLKGSSVTINKVLGISKPSSPAVSRYASNMRLFKMNPFDLKAYVDAFIKDAKNNHGLSLNAGEIFVKFEQLDGNTIALAYNHNKDNVVVLVDPENWNNATPIKRWWIMYHELGHDILNLDHNQGGSALMNATTQGINFNYTTFYNNKVKLFNYIKNNKYKLIN